MSEYFKKYLQNAIEVSKSLQDIEQVFEDAVSVIWNSISSGGKVLWFGNGGSASDAQHLSAELVGRFELNRRPLASIALNTDTSAITAIANDFGYEVVFERQVEALARKGDICIGITTSGISKNVLLALAKSKSLGIQTIAFCGSNTSELKSIADIIISVKSKSTCHIQEAHILIGQALCGAIERELTESL